MIKLLLVIRVNSFFSQFFPVVKLLLRPRYGRNDFKLQKKITQKTLALHASSTCALKFDEDYQFGHSGVVFLFQAFKLIAWPGRSGWTSKTFCYRAMGEQLCDMLYKDWKITS